MASFGNAVNNTDIGTIDWVKTGATLRADLISADDVRITATLAAAEVSHYIKGTDFAHNLPPSAVITGIALTVSKSYTGTGTIVDHSVRLVRRGVITGLDHSAQGAAWTDTDAPSTYGENGDLWGLGNITPDDLNAFDSGFVFAVRESGGANSAVARIDLVQMTIHYVAGYNSAPQVQERGRVLIGAYEYPLAPEADGSAGKVHETLATTPIPRFDTGGPGSRPTNRFIETYEVTDLRGGMGVWRYRSKEERNRFWSSQNMDTFWANSITLAPLVNDIVVPEAVTTANDTRTDVMKLAETLVVVFGQDNIYTHSGSAWSASIDTFPGMVSRPAWFNDRLFYATGSGYSYQEAPGGVATDVATPDFQSFVVWDNKLYGIDAASGLHSSPTGLAATWTALATMPLEDDNTTPLRYLKLFVDSSGDIIIWCLTHVGPWLYDAVNDKWQRARLELPFITANISFSSIGEVFQEKLFLHTEESGILMVSMAGGTMTVQDVSPSLPDGLPLVGTPFVADFAATSNMLFATVHGGSNPYQVMTLAWNGVGWHVIFYTTTAPSSVGSGVSIIRIGTTYRLYISNYDAAGLAKLSWMNLKHLFVAPLSTVSRIYSATGLVDLPYFDAESPGETKTAQQVRLKLNLQTEYSTETVTVSYRINGSTGSFTTLGSAIAVAEEVIIPFGPTNLSANFKSIQFRLTFASGGSTKAPILEYFVMDFSRKAETKRAFAVRIDMSKPYQGRTPTQMYDHLYSALKSTMNLSFAYRNDSDNARSYVVQCFSPDVVVNTGIDDKGVFGLTLVEMASG